MKTVMIITMSHRHHSLSRLQVQMSDGKKSTPALSSSASTNPSSSSTSGPPVLTSPSRGYQPQMSIKVNRGKVAGLKTLGPFLDRAKIAGLPAQFGPGPMNRIVRESVQHLVDASIDQKEVNELC